MNKQEIISALKSHFAEVTKLRRMTYTNGEFPQWREKVLHTLGDIYGADSSQYTRFANAPGKSFKVVTELGLQQDYGFKLDCYESALTTLIQRAEMG